MGTSGSSYHARRASTIALFPWKGMPTNYCGVSKRKTPGPYATTGGFRLRLPTGLGETGEGGCPVGLRWMWGAAEAFAPPQVCPAQLRPEPRPARHARAEEAIEWAAARPA